MAYKLAYSDYSTTTNGPPDPERWVGSVGPTGPKGEKGDKGDQGIPGAAVGIGEAPTDGATPFTAGNNIANSVTTTANTPLNMTCDGSKWFLR